MSYESYDQSSVQRMNRLTGPAVCHCSIVTGHRTDNQYCPRNDTEVYRSIAAEWTNEPASAAPGAAAGDGKEQP